VGTGVGRLVGAGDGVNVSTETLSTLTLAIAVEPEEVAYDIRDEASAPEETAELIAFVTVSSALPPSSTRPDVGGTVTSIEIDTADANRRLRVVRRDPSLHTCSPNEAPEITSPSAAFSTLSSTVP
jgi:hypothetical protein